MKSDLTKLYISAFFLLASLTPISAQAVCFDQNKINSIIKSIKNPQKPENLRGIQSELNKLDSRRKSLEADIVNNKDREESLSKRRQLLRDGIGRLCNIYKQYGWLNKETLGQESFSIAMYLIRNNDLGEVQRAFIPIFIAAAEKGEVSRADIATLVDSIRIKTNMPQLFGTQIELIDEIAYLYPLENEKLVDEWRKAYELPSLNDFMRKAELAYQTLVIKRRNTSPPELKKNTKSDKAVLGLEENEDTEIVKVSTNLVNLNVRILDKDYMPIRGLKFGVKDFLLNEDDKEQNITFFNKSGDPIDFYLVLDLSGSTARIRETIWKTVEIFVRSIKPEDRIAVLTHIDKKLSAIADLTNDRNKVTNIVAQFKGLGTSSIWDAISESYSLIENNNFKNRRSAIVLITDGLESESKLAFGNLIDRVKGKDTTFFSIQLPTDYLQEDPFASKRRIGIAKRALWMLAEESGGEYFNIREDNELLAIPERIINSIGETYSLGFEPSNTNFDGSWRQLKLKIINHNNVIIRAKTGYYAKP